MSRPFGNVSIQRSLEYQRSLLTQKGGGYADGKLQGNDGSVSRPMAVKTANRSFQVNLNSSVQNSFHWYVQGTELF